MLEKISLQLAELTWTVPDTVKNPAGTANMDLTPAGIAKTILDILMWVFVLAGTAFIIIGGIKYATSGGDEKKVANAKNTILYAVIGILVGVGGNILVRFVLNTIGITNSVFN